MLRCPNRTILALLVALSGCQRSTNLPAQQPIIVPSPLPLQVEAPRPPLERQEPPASAPMRVLPFPAVATAALPSGMKLDLIERRALPVVSITLMVDAGQARDGDSASVARITAQLLESGGAGRLTSTALRKAVDDLGATLSISTTRDNSRFSISVTSDRVPEALDILAALVQSPRFDRAEFGKLKSRELERVKSLAKTSGAWLAQYWLNRTLYGQPLGIHAYASIDVLPSEITRLSLEECRRFYREQYVPSSARLIVVGDIDLPGLTRHIERSFGTWKGRPSEAKAIAIPSLPERLTVSVVDRPGSAQSDILIGFFGPTRGTPEFAAISAAQQVVGGGVAGRLFLDVREKRSLAYSTYAATQETATGPSVLTLSAGTQTAKTADAVGALLENLDRMRQDAASEVELQAAQHYIVYGMPARWETVDSLGSQLLQLRTLGQSDRHFDEIRDAVARLTQPTLREIASRYYRRENAAIVIAGDAKSIAERLRHFGTVQVLDPEREFAIKQTLPALREIKESI